MIREGLRAPGVLCVLVIVVVAAAPVFGGPADELLSVGKTAFGDGQYPRAVTSFQRIQDEYPDSPPSEEASYMLGVSLFYAGRLSESLSAFSLFAFHHPGSRLSARASYWVGAANLRLGNRQAALDSLTAFLARDDAKPYRESAILWRSAALEGLGRDAEAGAGYRELLKDPPGANAAEATYRLACTELRAGRFETARDLYGKVLLDYASSPFVRDSVFFIGECELAMGRLTEAQKRFVTLLTLYPESPNIEAASFRLVEIAWRQKRSSVLRQADDFLSRFPQGDYRGSAFRIRGDALFVLERWADAVAAYARAASILPEGTEKQSACWSMAVAQLSLGKRMDAADSFARALSGGSVETAEKAGFSFAVLLVGEGKTAEGVDALRTYLEAFPRSARAEEAGRLRGILLEKKGDHEASGASWDFLIRQFPGSPRLAEYLYHRGRNQLARGQLAPALDDFQQVVKDHAGSAWFGRSAYSIGYVYALRGEYPRALPFFRSARSGDDSARAQLAGALCLFDMGKFGQALEELRLLQAISPAAASPGRVTLYIGRSLYRMGRLAEAAESLREAAAELASEDSALGADAHYWRGWALLRLRSPKDACDSFLALAKGYPDDPRRRESLFRAGVCKTMQSEDSAAVALFEEVISQSGPDADAPGIVEQAMYERGLALARMGRSRESADALEQLTRAFPSGRLAAQASYLRAETALAEGRFADAHAGFDRVARVFPDSQLAAQAAYWSAVSLLRAGDAPGALEGFWSFLASKNAVRFLTPALEGFESALREAGDPQTARRYSAKVDATPALPAEAAAGIRLAAAGILLPRAPDEALSLVEVVRQSAPSEPYAGEANLLMGRYAALRADWSRALDIFSALERSRVDDVGARASLEKGRTLESMGRTSDAVDQYLKVGSLFPGVGDRAAEGMASAVRLSRARGDAARAAAIEQALRATYPSSPWVGTLSSQ